MATPEKQIQFNEPSQEVTDTDDGGAIIQMEEDAGPEQAYEFYDNIVEMIPDDELTRLATQLEESIDRDKK